MGRVNQVRTATLTWSCVDNRQYRPRQDCSITLAEVRRFEYCTVSSRRDFTKEGFPWTDFMKSHNGHTQKVEPPMLSTMGSQGWELVGPPVELHHVTWEPAYNSKSQFVDLTVDVATTWHTTFYFKREIEQ